MLKRPGTRRRATQIQETIDRQPQLADEVVEMGHEQLVPERVMTRRYWRMRRERALTGHGFQRCAIR